MRGFLIFETLKCIRDLNLNLVFNAILCYNFRAYFKINEFNVILNIPATLKDFGIKEDEFKEKLSSIAELAVGDACTGSNPRSITPEQMEKLFTCTYYGTEVDF